MKQIKELVEYISDELKDAEEYAKKAIEYKISEKPLADVYHDISEQELKHADMEHNQIMRIISKAKETGLKVPESMQAVYDWMHERMIDHEEQIHVLLGLYNK